MKTIWAVLTCVLTVWLARGSCRPAAGTNKRDGNGSDQSPNEVSIKKALALLQAMESMLAKQTEEVQMETNEVEAEASTGHMKLVQKPSKVGTDSRHHVESDSGAPEMNTAGLGIGFPHNPFARYCYHYYPGLIPFHSNPDESNPTAGDSSHNNATVGDASHNNNATVGDASHNNNATVGDASHNNNATVGDASHNNATVGDASHNNATVGDASHNNATVGDASHNNNATVGDASHNNNATVGDASHNNNATVGDASHNNNATVGDASNNNATVGDASHNNATVGDASHINATVGDASNNNATVGDASNNNATVGDASHINATVGDASHINATVGDASHNNNATVGDASHNINATSSDSNSIGGSSKKGADGKATELHEGVAEAEPGAKKVVDAVSAGSQEHGASKKTAKRSVPSLWSHMVH